MIKLLIGYKTPADPAAFDQYYLQKHVPLAKKMPGIETFEVNRAVKSMMGEPPYYMLVELTFENSEALKTALQSEEGRVARDDVANFYEGEPDRFVVEVQIV